MQSILYFYLHPSPFLPLLQKNREELQLLLRAGISVHEIDLYTDALGWHYCNQWIEQQQEFVLLLDSESKNCSLPSESIKLIRQSIGRLLKYKRKISVAYLRAFSSSSFQPHCQPLERLPHVIIDSPTELAQLNKHSFRQKNQRNTFKR